MRASGHVGRGRGLAAALGVGAVLATGGYGVAWAAPASQDASAVAADSAAGSPADPRHRSERARGRAAERPVEAPAAAPARTREARPDSPVAPKRQDSGRSEGSDTTPTSSRQPLSAARAGLPAAARVTRTPVQTVVAVAAEPATEPQTTEQHPPPATAPPVAAVASGALASAGAVADLVDLGSGTGPLAPVGSALSWAVLAVARRPGTPQPAAATTTAGTVSATPLARQVTVNPIMAFFFNQTPTLSPVQQSQGPAGVISGALNPNDPDSPTLSYTLVRAPVNGVVVIDADGNYTYTPDRAAAHVGIAETFDVTVSDAPSGFVIHGFAGLLNLLTFGLLGSRGDTSTATVTVTVTPVNEAPTATFSVGSPDLNGVVRGTVVGADADGDPLTYGGSGSTGKGTVVMAADGSFSYTPTAAARHAAASLTATDAARADSFDLVVTDSYDDSAVVTVTVPITPANTNPTATASVNAPNAATGVVTGRVTGSDADGDVLSYTAPAASAKGTLVIAPGGTFTYTPTAAARHAAASLTATAADKTDSFTVTVSDGYGGSVNATFSVSISPKNSAPTGSISLGTADAATGTVVGAVLGSDADGDALAYTRSANPSKGTAVVTAAGGFTYTPTADARHAAASITATSAVKTDTFSVTITDGYGGSTAVPVSITISPLNTAPTGSASVGSPDAATGLVAGTLIGSDADGDALTYSGSGSTAKGSVVVGANGGFTYIPTAAARHAAAALTATAADSSDTLTLAISDGHGGSVNIPVLVTIAPQNNVPIALASAGFPDATTGLVAGTVIGSDADGDTLSYSGSGATAKGSYVTAPNGSFTYTPTTLARHVASLAGATAADTADTFTVTVSDGYGASVAVPVNVTISPAGVTFNFVYGTGSQFWSDSARGALQTAATSLASYIVVGAPVTITYSVTGENDPNSTFLASAYANFSSGSPGYYDTVVQKKILTGVDSNGAAADGGITWNFAPRWEYADSVAGNEYDFQSVAIHELMHTLGFITGAGSPDSLDQNWTVYDSFLRTSNGTAVIDGTYTFIPAYTSNLTGGGGGLYFAGPNAVAAYGGYVPLYTPGTWSSGSSLSHVDPAQVGATPFFMKPFYNYGPGVRTIGAVERGMLRDLGYVVYA
ncbi:MAG: Ig-like domain-containing protein [Mycobacterium sp.]